MLAEFNIAYQSNIADNNVYILLILKSIAMYMNAIKTIYDNKGYCTMHN